MTEGKRVSLNEVFAKKRQELSDYYNSPEGREDRRIADEKMARERRTQAIVSEGSDAAIAGKQLGDCPYEALSIDAELWIYGFDNPPAGDDEDADDETD